MRIRRSASRLLGSASAPAVPGFELPPPPAHESHAGFLAASETSSSPLETCELSRSPWDLMAQLHPSDPQEEKLFFETYFVAVAWRTSWLFQPSMPAASSIKQEEQQLDEADMATDMVDGVIFELRVPALKNARKRNAIKPKKTKKLKVEDDTAGEAPVWACKKNDSKGWFCRRSVSRPDSFCQYHTDYKPPTGSSKPTRKRDAAYAGEEFYYYAGFGPSRSKRHRVSSSSDTVPDATPDGQKEEAPHEEEKHFDSTAGQAQGDGADHQAEQAVQVEEPRCDNTAGIAGYDEESSDDSDFLVAPGDIKTKNPSKKRWRKPVKSRSLNSLM